MAHKTISINRAPVLNLWAAVVAERLGYKKGEALSLAKALTGQTAQRHAKELGIAEASEEKPRKGNKKKQTGAVPLRFLGKEILVMDTPEGIRAVGKDKLIEPESVEKYLKSKFGDALPEVRAAMEQLAKSVPPKELRAKTYSLYGQFTPQVPAGMEGWGAKGEHDVNRIQELSKK
jgi:hypothetical protein